MIYRDFKCATCGRNASTSKSERLLAQQCLKCFRATLAWKVEVAGVGVTYQGPSRPLAGYEYLDRVRYNQRLLHGARLDHPELRAVTLYRNGQVHKHFDPAAVACA